MGNNSGREPRALHYRNGCRTGPGYTDRVGLVTKSSAGRKTVQSKKQFDTIDEYIKTFPRDVQSILEKMRRTIRKAAPEAEETISYQIPTFKLNGNPKAHSASSKKQSWPYR